MRKYNIGDLVKIHFEDHCVGLNDPMECKVVGWIVKSDKRSYTLTSWKTITLDNDIKESNREITCILKSAILKIKKLR